MKLLDFCFYLMYKPLDHFLHDAQKFPTANAWGAIAGIAIVVGGYLPIVAGLLHVDLPITSRMAAIPFVIPIWTFLIFRYIRGNYYLKIIDRYQVPRSFHVVLLLVLFAPYIWFAWLFIHAMFQLLMLLLF